MRLLVIGQHELSMLYFLCVEFFGPDDGLSCVVNEYVQLFDVSVEVVYQVLDLFLRQKVALNYMQSIFPLIIVFLGLISQQGVVREPGGCVDRGTIRQELQTDLKTDFDATTSDQRSEAVEIGSLCPFGGVKGGTWRAEVTIEGMDFCVFGFANVAQHSYCLLFYSYVWIGIQRGVRLFGRILWHVPDLDLGCLLVYCCFQSLFSKQYSLLLGFSLYIFGIILFYVKELAHLAKNGVCFGILLLEMCQFTLLEDLLEFCQGGRHLSKLF